MQSTKDYINKLYKEKIPFLFILDFELQKPLVYRLDELPVDIQFATPIASTPVDNTIDRNPKENIYIDRYPISQNKYAVGFNKVLQHINYGNSFLLNYTCATPIITNVDLSYIYTHSNAQYRLKYRDDFIVSSPESFIKIRDTKIYTYPMKGTIDASILDAEQKILSDEKELAEHYTIVDLLRNDLSIVAKNVSVDRFRYIDRIKSESSELLQVSSEITGDIKEEYQDAFGDLLYALLPAGSISGAPKVKTLDIIAEVEQSKRGYYTGVFGVFDGSQVDSAVMIRYIENTENGLVYRSGGGITYKSNLEDEYLEMIQKIYLPISQSADIKDSLHSDIEPKIH